MCSVTYYFAFHENSLWSKPNIYIRAGTLENRCLQTVPDREDEMEFGLALVLSFGEIRNTSQSHHVMPS